MEHLPRSKVSPERFTTHAALGCAAALSAGMMLIGYKPGNSHPFPVIFPLLLGISGFGALTGFFISLFIVLREARSNLMSFLQLAIFGSAGLLFMLQFIFMQLNLTAGVTYALYALLLLTLALILNEKMARLLGSSYVERTSLALVIGLLNLGFVTWDLRLLQFQGIEEPSLTCVRNIYACLLLQPLMILGIRRLTARQAGTRGSRRRLKSSFRRHPDRFHFYVAHWISCALAAGFSQWLLSQHAPDHPTAPWLGSKIVWGTITLAWIPALWQQLKHWQQAQILPRNIRSPWQSGGGRAEQFLRQHHLPRAAQETWLGLRTAIIMIDHDPHEDCRVHLPALLYRARQMQCEQIMSRIFSEQILSTQTQGSQILVSMDPEHSIMSCTESLLILTVLYLDGLPLVEKRLKQLVRLLPLLDPDLARVLSEHKVEQLFSRLQGFFHLDYNWIDQSMRSGDDEASFDVRLENLNPRERQRVLTQLSSAQWLGNFIWISESARDRLKTESPFLASTIERWPIQLEQVHGKSMETAIFLIKFENLIPRLQRYHALDEIRSRLAPLPLPPLSQRVCEDIEASLGRDPDHIDLQQHLKTMSDHDWQGFRAKDMALDILLKMVARADLLERNVRMHKEDWQTFRRDTRELVQKIGYPSQELHKAHLSKLELRQLHELQRICLEPDHPRCREAWLLLASLPTRTLSMDAVGQLMQTIAAACRAPALRSHEIILHKAVEAFFHLARALPLNRDGDVSRVFEILARTLIEVEADQELLLAFMDGKLAMDQQRGTEITVSGPVLLQWKEAVENILQEPDLPISIQAAIDLRWRSFSNSNDPLHRAS
ncbi:MAG TPA: hypothetical protein VFO10_27400 [Oligoflexus sp.]|uniref:hypothetical protein n=1 Tax=Oligoflexus sp. TaxID=1971216 RepID=UPI002D7E8264|nr:hypothetical protein [Oligoflexus sp.]HET9241023.1 hypothetical protein [Oligoflexus sp.]